MGAADRTGAPAPRLGARALTTLAATEPRERLVRRARLLAFGGLLWHVLEAAIALVAGVMAGSIALIGFGIDSVIECVAGVVLLWRFGAVRHASHEAEERAQRLIAISFFLLAAYVAAESIRALATGDQPALSWVGIALAAATAPTMPLLARAKRRVGRRLHSPATVQEAAQTQICAYLSVALLVGLGANALLGWWWADPLAALAIAALAAVEGRRAWRGDGCGDCC